MKWWRRFQEWRERRRYPMLTAEPVSIEQLYEDSPDETPFLRMLEDRADPENEEFGYPNLFGADQEKYWEFYQDDKISLDQYKALAQLFYKTRNKQLSPAQITTEYLDIMGQTDEAG